MKDLWTDLLAAPAHRGRPRAGLRARGPAHGVADPRPRRRRDAQPRPHVVRRRRRGSDRRDDRRRDRSGTAAPGGWPRRRSWQPGMHDPATARAAYESAVRRHLFADHSMSRVLGKVLRRPFGARARSASSARAGGGAAATSPAGCSRTNRGRSCSHRVGGTAGSSPDRAPTAADRRDQRERRAFDAGSGSLRSSGGELTSTPSTVRSTPSRSRSCGSPDASTSIGISSLVGPS